MDAEVLLLCSLLPDERECATGKPSFVRLLDALCRGRTIRELEACGTWYEHPRTRDIHARNTNLAQE